MSIVMTPIGQVRGGGPLEIVEASR